MEQSRSTAMIYVKASSRPYIILRATINDRKRRTRNAWMLKHCMRKTINLNQESIEFLRP
jgi:hypothetical protein